MLFFRDMGVMILTYLRNKQRKLTRNQLSIMLKKHLSLIDPAFARRYRNNIYLFEK